MIFLKKALAISGIGTILLLLSQSSSYSQTLNSYEDYKLYCSPAAYKYRVQSSECEVNQSKYSRRLKEELSPRKNVNLNNFNSVRISDWRNPDPKLPWSEPVIVQSDFGDYIAVFDKNYKKYGDNFFSRSTEKGILSRWTTEELSIFS